MKPRMPQRQMAIRNMNTHERRESRVLTPVLPVSALVLAAVWLAGCSTTVYHQGDKAAGSSRTAALKVQTESQALAGTMATLNNLVDKPAADLKPQFQCFSAGLDSLVAAAKRGTVTGNELVRSNAAYFAAWHQQLATITNADVRSRSEARKVEVCNQFNTANHLYAQAQDDLRSLVDYLQDIRRALSADLTASGVEAVKPLVTTANTNAGKVQTALSQAGTELAALSTRMSSAGGETGAGK